MDYIDEAIQKYYIPGKFGYKQIAKMTGASAKTIESRIKTHPERYTQTLNADKAYIAGTKVENLQTNLQDSILKDIQKECTIKQLCDKHKITTRILEAVLDDMKEAGYAVSIDGFTLKLCKDLIDTENIIDHGWNGESVIRFGLCGDHQINSKFTQITHANNYYDICESEGIKRVYHTGDIDEGEEMRPGHKYECYTQGADDHVNEIAKNYPKREGIETWFITGNHDHSIIKRCGYDIGVAIANKRPDMKYLGMSMATINLTPNCTLQLQHPIDGTAYAISYKTQKMIDAMQGGDKPNILAIGHYHKAEYLFYRNIHAFQTGTFQAQTNWMKGKQIAANVGGWIIEIHVDEEGTIIRCKGEFIPYYKMVKDDYENWK